VNETLLRKQFKPGLLICWLLYWNVKWKWRYAQANTHFYPL